MPIHQPASLRLPNFRRLKTHRVGTLGSWVKLITPVLLFTLVPLYGQAQSASPQSSNIFDGATAGSEIDWELKKDEKGIQVYTGEVEGSKFKAVRATMIVDAKLSELAALVRDPQACTEWADLCEEAREHKRISETELYVYTLNNLPWPVKNRDALAHVIWQQHTETLAVTMTATATTDILPEIKGAVRLTDAITRWIFTPTTNNQVAVMTEAHVDPAGPTPAWFTNLLLVDSPFKTMINLRKLVATGRYDNVQFDFITEPAEQPTATNIRSGDSEIP